MRTDALYALVLFREGAPMAAVVRDHGRGNSPWQRTSTPTPVTDESQDRPFALMDQEAKAALRIAISSALP